MVEEGIVDKYMGYASYIFQGHRSYIFLPNVPLLKPISVILTSFADSPELSPKVNMPDAPLCSVRTVPIRKASCCEKIYSANTFKEKAPRLTPSMTYAIVNHFATSEVGVISPYPTVVKVTVPMKRVLNDH